MAPPTYRAGSTAGNAVGTNLAVNVPAGTADNDLLFVVLYREGGAWTLPGGWTQLYDVASANAGQTTTVAWRRASSEPASYTFNLSASVWRIGTMVAISGGIQTGSPIDISTSAADNNSSVVAPSMTTLTNDVMLLWLTASLAGADITVGSSAMTQGAELGGCEVWYTTQAVAGATGSKVFGNSGMSAGDWAGIFLAILPDTGAPPDVIPDPFGAYLAQMWQGDAVDAASDQLLATLMRQQNLFPLANRADTLQDYPHFPWRMFSQAELDLEALGQGMAPAAWWISIQQDVGGNAYTVSLAGGLDLAGVHTRGAGKALDGNVASSGALTRGMGRTLSGAIDGAGGLSRALGRAFSGNLAAAGGITRQIGKALAGSVAASGALALIRIILLAFAGGLAASGAVTRQLSRTFTGGMASSGTVARRLARALAGGLAASGAITRRLARTFTGGAGAAGSLAKLGGKALAGSLAASGVITRRAGKALAGSLAASGSIRRALARPLAGSLAVSGTVQRGLARAFAGSLAAAGSVRRGLSRTLAGQLALAAAVSVSASALTFLMECLTAQPGFNEYSGTASGGYTATIVPGQYTGGVNDCD